MARLSSMKNKNIKKRNTLKKKLCSAFEQTTMVTVLVTGGSGLVGKSLRREVERCDTGHTFRFLSSADGDLRSPDIVRKIFMEHVPDVVVHLANRVGGLYENMSRNYDFLLDNSRMNLNVVDACKDHGVKKLVNVLSTCVFPDEPMSYPLTSDQIHDGPPNDTNAGYAYSKRLLHVASRLAAHDTGARLIVINLTPTNIYGEHDNFDEDSAHVIPALIGKMHAAKECSGALYVRGSGLAKRQFLYAGDLARVVLRCIDDVHENADCIVCPTNAEVTIRDVVDALCKIMHFRGPVVYDAMYQEGQPKKTASDEEVRTFFPDIVFTPLVEGLTKTVLHFAKTKVVTTRV